MIFLKVSLFFFALLSQTTNEEYIDKTAYNTIVLTNNTIEKFKSNHTGTSSNGTFEIKEFHNVKYKNNPVIIKTYCISCQNQNFKS
jgi:hypothetical protein